MVEHLPDDAKIALAKQLQDVKKRASHVQKCLLVQIEGTGLFDRGATSAAWDDYCGAVEAANEIVSDEVKPAGLFGEIDPNDVSVHLGARR